MPGNDFDDFFEIDSNGNVAQEKTEPIESVSKSKPAVPPPTAKPQAPPPPKPPISAPAKPVPPTPPAKGTDDKLLKDLGDFDALFAKAETGSKPADTAAPSVDELLSDFAGQVEEVPAEALSGPKPTEKSKSREVEELFGDFLGDEKPEEGPTQAVSKSAPAAPSPKGSGRSDRADVSKPEEALEELFSEVSQAGPAPEGSGEVLESGLGIEYKQKRKKWIKGVVIVLPSAVLAVGLAAVVMGRFTAGGFFGWTWGQKAKDGYEAPSGRVLRQLKQRYDATAPLFETDRVEDYRKVQTELDAILKIDARNSPTDARLAEALLIMGGRTVGTNARKQINTLIAQAEKYHPEITETARAKSRSLLSEGQYAQAEAAAKAALRITDKDVETVNLLGEIFLSKSDLEGAAQYFNQVLSINPKWPRAQHFLAVVRLAQGNADDAERILRGLVEGQPPHPTSEIELWRLLYSHRGKVDEAKEGLRKLVETRQGTLSSFDLGRASRALAEIGEATGDLPGAVAAMEKSTEVDRSSHTNAYYLGRLYLTQKQYEKAANEFGRASSLSPLTAEYLVYEGNALREMGKLPDSLSELTKALEKEPLNVEGLFQLGLTQRALSRNDESVTSFENVLKSDPRHLESMVNLGELYLARDNFSMAKTHLRSAIALAPKNARARDALGEVLLLNRKFDEALTEFKLAEAEEPDNVSVLSNIGRTYLATGRIDKAAPYFEKALTLDPTRLDTQVAMGELLHRRKEYVKAADTYRNVLTVRPKDYDTRVKLAAVLIDQQSFQDAITELQEASKWSPNYYPTRLNLGIAWRGLGSLDASLEQLQNALAIRPEAAEAHFQVELTQIYRNDPINAEAAMEKALSYDPRYIDPLVALGDFYDSRNLYGKAVDYYLRAEKIIPKNSEILLKAAESYRKEGKNKQARVYYSKALGADKNLSDAYVGLGLISEDAGNTSQAIGYLKRAQALDPNDPKPYYYLGFLYKDTNQKKAAVLSFRKYLKLDPASKEKKDIEDQIYALENNP